MRLMAKRKQVEKQAFLFFSLVTFSACFIQASALSIDLDLNLGDLSELKIDLKKVSDVGGLLKTLAVGFQPLFEGLAFIYTLPDAHLYRQPLEIIKRNGFEVNAVKINSNEGFILTAWRIQCRNNCDDEKKFPVLLQHGLFCSGIDWLFMKPGSVLPYLLADNGYEVWIGNARGTQYSQEHKTLDPTDSSSDYWDHSVHDMGVDDVKATVDEMIKVTNKTKVNYVGYSMGTTMFFIYSSENQEHYAKNINRFVGLAPAMYISNFASQFKVLGLLFRTHAFHSLLLTLGKVAEAEVDGPLKYTPEVKLTFKLLNTIAPYFVPFAKKILHLSIFRRIIFGDPLIKNTPAVQRAMGHFPENISIQTVRHYIQFFAKKAFGGFDHPDPEKNRKKYKGNAVPPLYSVGNVKVPTLLIGGANDPLVVPADFKLTFKETKKCSKGEKCEVVEGNTVPCFTHLDFIWGPNEGARDLVYNQIQRWFDNTWNESYWPEVSKPSQDSDYCRDKYLEPEMIL